MSASMRPWLLGPMATLVGPLTASLGGSAIAPAALPPSGASASLDRYEQVADARPRAIGGLPGGEARPGVGSGTRVGPQPGLVSQPGVVSPPAPAAPRALVHPLSAEGPLAPGQRVTSPLPTRALAPVQGRWVGPPLLIHDNPESFSRPGVLGSTIAPVPGRGDGTFDFPGAAEVFALANNRTGAPQRFSTVVQNTSDRPMTLRVEGVVYSKKLTPTDGRVPVGYAMDGGFRGPHAITARSALAAVPGQNGYSARTFTLAPGELKVVSTTGVHAGGEVFSRLALRAGDASQTFRVASVASPAPLAAGDLAALRTGRAPVAGLPRDYAPAGPNRLGRPNGVVEAGSTFEGGRTVRLTPGTRTGDLIYATRFKNAGPGPELPSLTHTLPNPAGVGPQATISDGAYGARHRLRYQLDNPSDRARRVEVILTAPSSGDGPFRPLGGQLTLPVRVDGRIVEARVDARGEGRVLAVVEVAPGARRPLDLELVHVGNTFPPAGIELRVR